MWGPPGAKSQPAGQEEAGRASKEERKVIKKTRLAGDQGGGGCHCRPAAFSVSPWGKSEINAQRSGM